MRVNALYGLSLALALASATDCALATVSEAQYNAVIEQARRGDTGPALEQLKAWAENEPRERQYLYDYAVVLVWAGQTSNALGLWPRLDLSDTPDYVLFTLGNAARHAHEFAMAQTIYQRVLQHEPRNPEASAALALIEADTGKVDAALDHIRAYLEPEPKPYRKTVLPLLHSRANVQQRKALFFEAAETYAEILAIEPADREALRERVFVTARLGAPQLALSYALRNAALFDDQETRRLRDEVIEREIRWGEAQLAHDPSSARYSGTDRALADSESLDCSGCNREQARESREIFNRMLALRDRVRMRDVITLYEQALRSGLKPPPYALAAAADAYSYEYKPARARDLYRQALEMTKSDPGAPNHEWTVGLVYAYVACGQFSSARKLVDTLMAREPPYVNRGLSGGVQIDNAPYIEVRQLQALERLFEGRLDESQQLLEHFLIAAPYNPAARTSYGTLLSVREKPRAAREQFGSVLVDAPEALDARIGYAEMQLALHEYAQAESAIKSLISYEPASREVQRAEREYQLYQRPQLIMQGNGGSTDSASVSSVTGSRDYGLETWAYSSPIDYRWRVYGHHYYAETLFDDIAVARSRIGLGGEYRGVDWNSMLEVNGDTHGDAGLSATTLWAPTDRWRVKGALDTNSNEVPLKARLASISGRDYQATVTRIVNESRHFDAGGMYVDFTDGNQRTQWHADWFERWRSGPVYLLDTTVDVGRSSNTVRNAPYFNPASDSNADLTLVNDWLTWRDPWRSFRQRVIILGGGYQQAHFGTSPIWGVRYEHEWSSASEFIVSYGFSRVHRSYDGVPQGLNSVYFNVNWML